MYGKFFASTYTGSMYGAGSDIFAVWGYVIANTINSQVELNPKLLAATLGTTEERIIKAIDYLCSPDPSSRSKIEDGKRLIREGQFAYRVPTFLNYRNIRSEDERREYNRIKKQESRARLKVKGCVNDNQRLSSMSANTESEASNNNHKGGNTTYSSEKIAPPPKYTQNDFDERDLRKIAAAENELLRKLSAQVGYGEQMTEDEFLARVCEEVGITVQRGLHLKKIQRQWPEGK